MVKNVEEIYKQVIFEYQKYVRRFDLGGILDEVGRFMANLKQLEKNITETAKHSADSGMIDLMGLRETAKKEDESLANTITAMKSTIKIFLSPMQNFFEFMYCAYLAGAHDALTLYEDYLMPSDEAYAQKREKIYNIIIGRFKTKARLCVKKTYKYISRKKCVPYQKLGKNLFSTKIKSYDTLFLFCIKNAMMYEHLLKNDLEDLSKESMENLYKKANLFYDEIERAYFTGFTDIFEIDYVQSLDEPEEFHRVQEKIDNCIFDKVQELEGRLRSIRLRIRH